MAYLLGIPGRLSSWSCPWGRISAYSHARICIFFAWSWSGRQSTWYPLAGRAWIPPSSASVPSTSIFVRGAHSLLFWVACWLFVVPKFRVIWRWVLPWAHWSTDDFPIEWARSGFGCSFSNSLPARSQRSSHRYLILLSSAWCCAKEADTSATVRLYLGLLLSTVLHSIASVHPPCFCSVALTPLCRVPCRFYLSVTIVVFIAIHVIGQVCPFSMFVVGISVSTVPRPSCKCSFSFLIGLGLFRVSKFYGGCRLGTF